MIRFSALRHRFLSEYPLSLLTSYLAMAAGIVAQIFLVPIYLRSLGAKGFGELVLVLGVLNYAGAGILWLGGVLQRALGEAFGKKDHLSFIRAADVGKMIYVGYAIAAAFVGICVFEGLDQSQFPTGAAIAAGLYLVAAYELNLERLALSAAGRQSASNTLQFSQIALYAILVIFTLRAGGGLLGVFACQLISVLITRTFVRAFWQGMRPKEQGRAPLRPFLARIASRTSGEYFIAGALLISTQSDVLLVGWLGGAEDAARFVLIWKIAEVGVQVLWRIPEMMIPILIRLDAMGDHSSIKRQYLRVGFLLLATAIPAGLIYAFLGPWITKLWLGAEHAPHDLLGFAIAGASIVWAGLARLPSVLAYSLARFRIWNRLALVEVVARFALTVTLYPRFGYLSPLIALNAVHLCGIAFAYQWSGIRLLSKNSARSDQMPAPISQ